MLAQTLQVPRPINRHILEHLALASSFSAFDDSSIHSVKIMLFEAMAAEAGRGGPDGLAIHALFVAPGHIKPILSSVAHFGLELFIFFLTHHLATICVSYYLFVFKICLDISRSLPV